MDRGKRWLGPWRAAAWGAWKAASLGIRPGDGPKPGNGKPEPLQMKLPQSSLAGAQVWLVPGAAIQGRVLHAACQGVALEWAQPSSACRAVPMERAWRSPDFESPASCRPTWGRGVDPEQWGWCSLPFKPKDVEPWLLLGPSLPWAQLTLDPVTVDPCGVFLDRGTCPSRPPGLQGRVCFQGMPFLLPFAVGSVNPGTP